MRRLAASRGRRHAARSRSCAGGSSLIFYESGPGAALFDRLGDSKNACSAFHIHDGIAAGGVGVVGRLRQRSAGRSGSSGPARAQGRYRSCRTRRASGTGRATWAAGAGRPAKPEHSCREIGLRVRLYGAVPGQRSSGDGLLRSDPQPSAVPWRTWCVVRARGLGVQYSVGRGLRRIAAIAALPVAVTPVATGRFG